MQQFYVTHLENEDKPQETKVCKESKYMKIKLWHVKCKV